MDSKVKDTNMTVILAPLTQFDKYAQDVMELRYSHVVQGHKESWKDIAKRVVYDIVGDVDNIPVSVKSAILELIIQRKFIPGGRILSQAGRPYHQTDNCFCLQAVDTREGWAELAHKTTMMFMSGGGCGVDYSDIRPYGSKLSRSGGIASGPIPLIEMVNSIGAAARQGGERRGAIYASLAWNHPDIQQFIAMKQDGQSLKHTNISTRFDNHWNSHYVKVDVQGRYFTIDNSFTSTLHNACKYGDPGFQFDADGQILRNACTEIITEDDSDSCCLGSVNLSQINSVQELATVTELGTLFLLCATMYTDCPTDKVKLVKDKNRRLGLGLMGVGEWFIQRQQAYGQRHSLNYGYCNGTYHNDIGHWLTSYKDASDESADYWSGKLSIARPVAVRAVAPTGTISTAIGLTTPGIEPVFHTAYQRTYNTLKSKQHSNGYVKEIVIDPVVQKWIEQGYDVRDIDTAYTLGSSIDGIERRLSFQAYVQSFVDNAISSTINLPEYVEGIEDKIAPILLKYLPNLRGVTFYPDGRYENQPVVPVDIHNVLPHRTTLREHESCKLDSCGN